MEGFGDIAEKLRRSTVQVRSGRHGQGSGIIVSSDDALEGSGERVIRLQFLRGDPQVTRTVAVRLGVPSLAAA